MLSCKRASSLLCLMLLGLPALMGLAGCSHKEDAVDAPLMKTAPTPPPRPNKPSVSPSGAGGGPAAAAPGKGTSSQAAPP